MTLACISVALLSLCGNAAAFVAPHAITRSSQTPSSLHFIPASTITSRSSPSWLHLKDGLNIPRGGGAALKATGDALNDVGGSNSAIDFAAIAKYVAGTGAEFGVIMGVLFLVQAYVFPQIGVELRRAAVFFMFGFLAMKSRTFSPLNARRPKVSEEREMKNEARRPEWMPPPKVFPLIWITIGLLRAISSTMVWGALGGKLVSTPIAAMVFHLSVGDTWNHINNVEKRLGVAVPVVFLVWLSVANTAWRYYKTLPVAGFILLPSVAWIFVANFLVQSIWRLNGRESLYPVIRKG